MSENQEPNGGTTPQQTNGSSGGNPVNNVVQKGKKAKQMAQNIKKMAQTIKKLSMSGPLMTVLFWVFVAIVALIIITGLIMFIVTMPGMIMDKLKALFKEIGNYVASFFGADTTQQIDDVRIFETLDYIEDMGWDLKSEGFLTGYYDNDDKTEIEKELDSSQKEAGYNVDEKQGVVRSSEGNIILAQSDFIFTYIMSDNYVYTLKNENLATQNDPDANWFEKLVTGAATAWYKIRNFTLGPIYDAIGLTEDTMDKWGKGLIAIYYDDGLGVEGNPVNGGTLFNWDSIKIDTESKKLSIVKNDLFNLNNPIEYSLDGWTGRYGMPLEFLLAVHKATMMPDLAFDMATSFNTNVNVYLHDISDGMATAAYKTPNGQYITFDKVNKAKTGVEGKNIFSAIFAWFDNLIESDKETIAMAELGVDVCTGNKEKDNCSCTVEKVYYYFNADDDPVPKGDYILKFDESTGKYYFQSKVTEEKDGEKTEKIDEVEFDTSKDKVSDIVVETTATDVCDRCEKVSKQITNILQDNNDYYFDYYMPYIANVSKHWYRDVYFVLSEDTKADYKGEEELAFVDYDYDYESVMKERWTLYETYTDNEEDGYKYNPEKVGEFIVFLIDKDGKYKKDENGEYLLYDGTFEEARGEVLFTKNDKNEYTLYTGVVNDNGKAVDKDGKELAIELYRKIGKDEYTLYDKNETIAVAKKPVTFDETDTDKLEDVGWNNDSGLWTAYEEDPNSVSSGWDRLFTDDTVAGISDEYEKYVKQNAYINISSKNNIVQVGEGQRAETNTKIKKMFLQNKYFRYDGSTETADIITALREQEPDNDDDNIVYGALDEEELKKTVTIGEKTYKASDYAGTVVLNQDSLNAFSMLENTHTLDADYIYRDFKELIVELGYFEKEELTDETAKLLSFPIPEIGSSGFPDRTIDKREVEEGTMVHSTHDIIANKKYTLKELVNQMGEEISEEGDPNAQAVSGIGSTNVEDNISAISSPNEEQQPEISSRVNNDRLSLSANVINTTEVGAISARKSPSQITVEEFIKSTREMCEFINKVGYDYCVLDLVDDCSVCSDGCVAAKRCLKYKDECSCTTNHCKHNIHENSCGLPTTFEASKAVGKNNFCCATLVSWALQNVGVMPDEDHIDGAESLASYCLDELKGEKIETSEELEPGDILCYEGHVDICGEKNGSGFIKYNGGHQVRIGATQGGQDSCIEEISGWPSNALYAVRLDWGKHEEAPYEGYVGNEAVVSPVSGILLEYGVYEVSKDSDSNPSQDIASAGNSSLTEVAAVNANVNREIMADAGGGSGTEDTTTDEENAGERINIDLKYGPSLNLGNAKNAEGEEGTEGTETTGGEETTPGTEETTSGGETTEEDINVEKREWSDTVGYARILVLNKEIFEMLDSSVNHRWRNDNDGDGLLSTNGQFYDMVTTEEQLEELTDESTGDFLSETVYGYKEFTEMYEKYGIAGYYVYIDGFKCELPDPDFIDSDDDGELSDEEGNPDGEDLTYDSFKIKTTQIENENKLIESLYETPLAYKVASKKATEKLNTEEAIKTDTYSAMVIDNPKSYEPLNNLEELIFIKEGTVLGRTYTDKELVEERLENGDDEKYDYEYYAPEEDTVVNEDGEEEENLDKLIGNYVMVRMSDPNKTVENVENYMKLDEVTQSEPNDWELFFWLPFESGGTDEDGCGPESQGTCSEGETAVGIIQWTVLTSKNMNNISSQFITGCLEENPTLCAPLSAYKNWSAQDFWNDYNSGNREFQKTLSDICDTDRDNFLSVQMQVAKKQYLDPLLESYPWLEDRPSCVQGAVMHLKVWGASTSWLPGYATSSDEEIILKVRNTIANTSSTAGEATGDENSGRAYNEPQIALEILTGAVSTEDVEQWVRTRDTSVFDFKFK